MYDATADAPKATEPVMLSTAIHQGRSWGRQERQPPGTVVRDIALDTRKHAEP